MDRLALETLLNIFYYLNFSEKLNLALTNKYWYTLIHNNVLYNDLSHQVPRHWKPTQPDGTASVIMPKLYESELCQKGQVRQLSLGIPTEAVPNMLRIIPYMPSIEGIELVEQGYFLPWKSNASSTIDCPNRLAHSNSMEIYDSWKKLKWIRERVYNGFSSLLLRSGTFEQLREIKVNFELKRDKCLELCQKLGQAPSLHELEIHGCIFSLELLEVIHKNTPSLGKLGLDPIEIVRGTNDLFYEAIRQQADSSNIISIQPANKMKYFQLDLTIIPAQPGQSTYLLSEYWFKYISIKYPELTTLYLSGDSKETYPIYYQTELVKALSKLKHLSVYAVEMYYITPKIVKAMNEGQIKIKKVFVDGRYKPVSIAKQLGNLLSSSTQSESINAFQIFHINMASEVQGKNMLTKLAQFRNLANLALMGYNHSFDCYLEPILECLPNLEYLVLTAFKHVLLKSPKKIQVNPPSRLKKFAINRTVVGGSFVSEEFEYEKEFDDDLDLTDSIKDEDDGDEDEVGEKMERRWDERLVIDPYINSEKNIFDYLAIKCPELSKLVINDVDLPVDCGTLRIHFPNHYFSKLSICMRERCYFMIDNGLGGGPRKLPRRDCDINKEIYHKVSLVYKGLPNLDVYAKFSGTFFNFVM